MKIEYYAVILSSYEEGSKTQYVNKINFTTKEEAERYIDIHRKELFTTRSMGYAGTEACVVKKVLDIEEKAE